MSKKLFKRNTLIVGSSFIYEGEAGAITANQEAVTINVKLESMFALQEFAKALSDAWKDHNSLEGKLRVDAIPEPTTAIEVLD